MTKYTPLNTKGINPHLADKQDHTAVLGIEVFPKDKNLKSAKLELTYKDGSIKYKDVLIADANSISGHRHEMPVENLWSYLVQTIGGYFNSYIEKLEPDLYTINDLMKVLKPARCAIQSTQGPSTEFTPYYYVPAENKWYGYTRNGSNNVYIKMTTRLGDKKIWYTTQSVKKILPKNHDVSYQLRKTWAEKYREHGDKMKGISWSPLAVKLNWFE